jgi:glycosyltransferase involved in cell wall biosynthesis
MEFQRGPALATIEADAWLLPLISKIDHKKRLRPLFFLHGTYHPDAVPQRGATLSSLHSRRHKAFLSEQVSWPKFWSATTDPQTDPGNSQKIGCAVIHVSQRGYGAALIAGIQAAQGKFVIMGDGDDSYDFSQLDNFSWLLRQRRRPGDGQPVQGWHRTGRDATPCIATWATPVLSWLGRTFFRVNVGDFHCGLRGFSRDAILRLGLVSPGHGVRHRDGGQSGACRIFDP